MKAGADSPRNVPKRLKISHVQPASPAVKAKFNPAENDESPCVSPTDGKSVAPPYAQYFRKWLRAAIAVTIASLVFSLILAVFALVSTVEFSSSSVLASASDTVLAFVGSSVVLWRFRDRKNGDEGARRESIGSLIFGAVFEFNGAITIAVAVYHLVNGDEASGTEYLLILLGFAAVVYFTLAAAEFYISRKLRSSVMASLCVDDALTAVMHLGLVVGKISQERLPSLWYLDHYTAIGVALLIFCCGFKILVDVLIFKELPFQALFA